MDVGLPNALDQLVRDVHGARGALLASVDGFAVASSGIESDDPSHAAMLAAAMGLGGQLVGFGDGSNVRQIVVDHDNGLIVVRPIGPRRVLAVVADADLDQLQLRVTIQACTSRLMEVGAS